MVPMGMGPSNYISQKSGLARAPLVAGEFRDAFPDTQPQHIGAKGGFRVVGVQGLGFRAV